jgi:hypothetical protein
MIFVLKSYFYRCKSTSEAIQGVLSVRWYRSPSYAFRFLKGDIKQELGTNQFEMLEFRRIK